MSCTARQADTPRDMGIGGLKKRKLAGSGTDLQRPNIPAKNWAPIRIFALIKERTEVIDSTSDTE